MGNIHSSETLSPAQPPAQRRYLSYVVLSKLCFAHDPARAKSSLSAIHAWYGTLVLLLFFTDSIYTASQISAMNETSILWAEKRYPSKVNADKSEWDDERSLCSANFTLSWRVYSVSVRLKVFRAEWTLMLLVRSSAAIKVAGRYASSVLLLELCSLRTS